MENKNGVLLGREHLLAAEFASTEEHRYALTGLHVMPDGTAEATNGHYLIRVPPCPMPADDFPEVQGKGTGFNGNGLLIPAAACKEALKSLRKENLPILETAHLGGNGEAGKAVLTTTDLETTNARQVKTIEGSFPNTDQVIPHETETITIGMDARYLKQIAEYAIKVSRNGKASVGVTLTLSKDPDKAANNPMTWNVTLQDGDRKALIVLMPMRV